MNRNLTGLPAWLIQRLSALYMTLVTLLMVAGWPFFGADSYEQWLGLIAHPVIGMMLILFFIALFFHAWVGMRDVILDYLGRWPLIRLTALGVLGCWLMVMGGWMVRVFVRVMVI